MTKKRNNIHMLSAEQQDALGKFSLDFRRAAPTMVQMAQTAKKLHQAMIDAPVWRIAESPKPEGAEEPQLWSVGHAKINYVDHIKTEGTQSE